QAADAALDDVPPPVALAVEPLAVALLVLLVRDHRLDAALRQPIADPVGRVALVPGQLRRLLRPQEGVFHEGHKPLRLMLLAGAAGPRQRRAVAVAQQMHLGAEAALAPTQSVILGFFRRPVFSPRPRPPTGGPGSPCRRWRTAQSRSRRSSSAALPAVPRSRPT